MTFVHVVTRVVLGIAVTAWPLQGSILRWFALAVVILAALIWAGLDGIRDGRAHPSEREETDLTMTWLKAGAVAGVLSGAICWLIGAVSDLALGENSLFFEITSGAAFTLLLVFVPAMAAVALGRFLAHREEAKAETTGAVAPVPVGAAVAAGGTDDQWSHEDGTGEHHAADSRYADDSSADDAPTEVFRAVRPEDR